MKHKIFPQFPFVVNLQMYQFSHCSEGSAFNVLQAASGHVPSKILNVFKGKLNKGCFFEIIFTLI